MLGFSALAVLPVTSFGGEFTSSAASNSGGTIMDVYVRLTLNSFTIDEASGGGGSSAHGSAWVDADTWNDSESWID